MHDRQFRRFSGAVVRSFIPASLACTSTALDSTRLDLTGEIRHIGTDVLRGRSYFWLTFGGERTELLAPRAAKQA